MALDKYQQKRSFEKTPEPTGGRGKGSELIFVIQKHAASHLHYDFRLEMEGVLKSWAVPKGPSMDPAIKHLAMMVEDHPYDYKDFEGVIPAGNYGAGTVIVWDHGTYVPLVPARSKKEAEKLLLQQLETGSLKFELKGKKLKGEFALVKTHGRGENSWLLIKHRDKFATEADITLKDKSVISGKTLEKMAAAPEKIYGEKKQATKSTSGEKPASRIVKETLGKVKKETSPKPAKSTTAASSKKKLKTSGLNEAPDLSGAPKTAFPKTVKPMLATLVENAVEGDQWQFEIKWDGYRAIALCNKSKLDIISRNNKSFNEKFYAVFDALKALNLHAVMDGEIAVLKEDGVTSFGALQNWRSEADGDLVYYVFDLLWLNGHNLKELPLTRRQELLLQILPAEGAIRPSKHFETTAAEFLEVAEKLGMEGIIAKRRDSIYKEGDRGQDWLKIKIHKRHEVVIGGYTQNDNSRKTFSSLLVGVYKDKKLNYIGKIGTGFSVKLQQEMMLLFKPLITDKSPFDVEIDINKPSRFRPNPPNATATWLKPKLVCEVSYAEITSDGVMRHPSFVGMREDKDAKDVHAEEAKPIEELEKSRNTEAVKKSNSVKGPAKEIKSKKTTKAQSPIPEVKTKTPELSPNSKAKSSLIKLDPVTDKSRKSLLNPTDESQVREVNRHELKFSHLSKVYWPKEGYTKRDLLNYYYQVAPYILPFLKDRPQSLNRFPNGINGESFYHKNVTATAPEWVKQFPYHTSDGEDKNFLVVEDDASILWMANLGAIEMNPWNSTIQKPDHPDWCIIDLDPTEKNSFDQVIQTALVTKKVLDEFKVTAYPKTSGSTGIHIYIPMGALYLYEECQMFARIIATEVHRRLPAFTSIERMTNKRKGKIYVDFLQNRPKATLAAPYSVRPKPGATVSMPLEWSEVKKGLTMSKFTMLNALARIRQQADLFKPVLGKGIDLHAILDAFK